MKCYYSRPGRKAAWSAPYIHTAVSSNKKFSKFSIDFILFCVIIEVMEA